MKYIPVKNGKVLFNKEADGEYVLFNPANGRLCSTNTIGFNVWNKCDGHKTIEGIIDELYQLYDIQKNVIQNDIFIFVKELEQKEFLKIN